MRTDIVGELKGTTAGAIAADVIGACVHCGMCNSACPTYALTGDELDGPRGRIYLMKQALEGEPVGPVTQHHLDRCLECRACEAACPSGVDYHVLLNIGREFVGGKVRRGPDARLGRWAVRLMAAYPAALAALFAAGRAARRVLPPSLATKIPPRSASGRWPKTRHPRRMLILGGCVQRATAPGFNAATARVFDRLGISLTERRGCCGAVPFHLGAGAQARASVRRQIDAWNAALDVGHEAIVVTASGCAAFIRDWPHLMAEDAEYAGKARRIVACLKDPIEIIGASTRPPAREPAEPRIAVHDPCTLRNGPGLGGKVAALLASFGYEPSPVATPGGCCGSAGSYSLFQPELAGRLREETISALTAGEPAAICTANIGCWMHLAAVSPVPVRHWIEAVDDLIS
ncbi:MAG: glycolate oxidase subunit GlcF [Caulobacteraceae bacterium]